MEQNKKILAFGASNSRRSINKRLAEFASSQIEHADVIVLDLNDFEMPIYSIDRENENGIPPLAYQFKEHILNSDGIIISFAEHNGAYTVAFKNIFDWISRIEKKVWADKPLFLLATSPGGRGAQGVLEIAYAKFKRMTASEVFKFSLPSFSKNFNEADGILNSDLNDEFKKQVSLFVKEL